MFYLRQSNVKINRTSLKLVDIYPSWGRNQLECFITFDISLTDIPYPASLSSTGSGD